MSIANAGIQIYLAFNDNDFTNGLSGASASLSTFAEHCQGLSQRIGITPQSIAAGLPPP